MRSRTEESMRSPIYDELPGQLGWQGIRSILRRLLASPLRSSTMITGIGREWTRRTSDARKSWMLHTARKLRMH
ncbi:hypothetical protein B9Z55_010636 [Caenorhabditis nigoni]|uniref:Uncharacterized protein n=1 Tax=Caenorhabditis nigoni TaxID=1611254 RepID=A0A2G5UHP9_9PELO|nr:hypothetical protein B9Z55_010636 [Caenorhabditis nigoni]